LPWLTSKHNPPNLSLITGVSHQYLVENIPFSSAVGLGAGCGVLFRLVIVPTLFFTAPFPKSL
jgi:hypothetical protein